MTFVIHGTPQTAGSKRAFPIRRKDGGLGVAVSDANPKTKSWQREVKVAAIEAMRTQHCHSLPGPVHLTLVFNLQRPKGHYRTGRLQWLLKPSAPRFPTTKPDALKLARAIEDALTGICYRDDSQVVFETISKLYARRGQGPSVEVTVLPLKGVGGGEEENGGQGEPGREEAGAQGQGAAEEPAAQGRGDRR